jgi:hypothetical protein
MCSRVTPGPSTSTRASRGSTSRSKSPKPTLTRVTRQPSGMSNLSPCNSSHGDLEVLLGDGRLPRLLSELQTPLKH